MPKKLYLIDGHAQTYRSYYALENLTAPDGTPAGAAFGFTRVLRDILTKHSPDYIGVAFDRPEPTFRHKEFKDYKATRKAPPPELLSQIPIIQNIVSAFNIPIFTKEGFEADDILGCLALKAHESGIDTVIVSGDKDLAQLLNDHTTMYDPKKDEWFNVENYTEKKGFSPGKLIDVMGLWGDSSDNIPGVPGIGEKGASKLIAEYGSLEALLENADKIKGKRGENLRTYSEQAKLSKWLATIKTDFEIDFDIDSCIVKEPNNEKLLEIYDQLGFESLKKTLGGDVHTVDDTSKCKYKLVNSGNDFDTFIKELEKQELTAFDVETTSTDPMQAELVGMSFSWKEEAGFYLPFKAPEGDKILSENDFDKIARILESEKVKKTGHNIKYDALVMRRHGVKLKGIAFDSMLASHLLSGHIRGHSLDATCSRLLHINTIHIEELIGKGKNQITMDMVPLEDVYRYASEDADIALRLYNIQKKQIKERNLNNLFESLVMPLSKILTDMQFTGIRVNPETLSAMSKDLQLQLAHLEEEIYYLADKKFNISSPKQLSEILFDELGFPVIKKTKTSRSTDEKVLSELSRIEHEKNELPKLILEYRTYTKLKNTYLDALPEMINPHTGRIHTTFNQTGTATGRLSSSDPNLQNIPIRSEEGRGIRAAFLPEEGWSLLSADYSQIELRMLAHLSGDSQLVQAFKDGKDIHRTVASQVYRTDEEEVTPEQRQAAKAVNFGLIYGQSAFGLSQTTAMSRSEAKQFMDMYFAQFPDIADFLKKSMEKAKEEGGAKTILGRWREIPELKTSNKTKQMHGERQALSTIIQGSAADLIKTAMVNVAERIEKEKLKSKMLLQIHDELVVEFPPDEEEKITKLVKEEMENAFKLSVPLAVDIGIGKSWLDVK